MRVYIDTSALYAVLDRDDDHHPQAAAVWSRLLEERATLVVSSQVLVEIWALTQHRLGMDAARALADAVEPVLSVEWVSREDHEAGRSAVLAANRRDLSLVDCTSFVVMRRLGLNRAFAFDHHFSEQGFELVGAD